MSSLKMVRKIKLPIVFIVIGGLLVGSYGILFLWGAFQTNFVPGWWKLSILPHYAFTIPLLLGLFMLVSGLVMLLVSPKVSHK